MDETSETPLSIFREFPEPLHYDDWGRRHDHRGTKVLALAALSVLAFGLVAAGSARRGTDRSSRRRGADDAPAHVSTRGYGHHPVVGKTVLIGRPKADLYEFWKDFRNLPHFMANIRSVEVDGRLSTWKIAAPAGQTVTAEVELVEDRPNERLAWKSTPSSPIATEGSVTFRDAPAGRGTYVEAVVEYRPPAGQLGRIVADLFRREPHVQARHELKRFKMLMEAGEVATSTRTHAQS